MLDLLRHEAYALRGVSLPPTEKPVPAPVLFHRQGGFVWRGSTGAACYTIERAAAAGGPWTVMAVGLADSIAADARQVEDRSDPAPMLLWFDETAAPGRPWFYRVKGFNAGGETEYSPVLCVDPQP
jgi:hypothetical protein